MNDFYPPFHYFICPTCNKDKEIPPSEFAAHVKEIHGITETKGKRDLMVHINKRPRHFSSYEWKIGDKTFYEYYG
jgi:hypothetical protein